MTDEQKAFVERYTQMLIEDGRKETAFTEAARWGHVDLVRQMLDSGMDVNARDENGGTALILAASGGQIDVMRLLIDRGADVNARHHGSGMTPLTALLAALHQENVYVDGTRTLLEEGADASISASDRKTPLDWAKLRRAEGGIHIDQLIRLLEGR